jgi:NAD(P)-dependent dehydrogenase (short-subunit alcohol dehydrogenase family)
MPREHADFTPPDQPSPGPATFDKRKVAKFGNEQPLDRVGEPSEVAPSFVFLASEDSSYMTGQVLHPNGGEVING